MQRQAHIFVGITLGLSCAGCLVTNELDFEANRNLSSVVRISPNEISWAPATPDPRCGGADAVVFEADYFDDDVDQQLYIRPLVNGMDLNVGLPRALPDPAGSARHIAEPICVPRSAFDRNCNVVQFMVASDNEYDKLIGRPPPYGDPEIASVTWIVGPPARETPAVPARPYVSFSECFSPDGGT